MDAVHTIFTMLSSRACCQYPYMHRVSLREQSWVIVNYAVDRSELDVSMR